MERRDFLSLSSAALAAGFLLDPRDAIALSGTETQPKSPAKKTAPPPPADPQPIIAGPPVLQNPSPDGVTVFLGVRGISTAWIEYGKTEKLGLRADTMRHGLLPLNGLVHRVRLDALDPAARYFYRVGVCPIDFKGPYKITRGPAEYSPTFSFRTHDESADTAAFYLINDTHENTTTLRGVSDQIQNARARRRAGSASLDAPVFWNGDIFNDVRSDQQIAANILTPPRAPDTAAGYASTAPLHFVSGNHDVRGIHARSLDQFIDTPNALRYAIVRHGPVAFIVLDTGEDKPDDHPVYAGLGAFDAYRDRQRVWLEGALKDQRVTSARHRVVVQHIPMWGDGSSEDARRKWAGLLHRANITAMICGHTHKFAYTPADHDHPYPQIVGGGPAPESATFIDAFADGANLSVIVRDLAGAELASYHLRAPG